MFDSFSKDVCLCKAVWYVTMVVTCYHYITEGHLQLHVYQVLKCIAVNELHVAVLAAFSCAFTELAVSNFELER